MDLVQTQVARLGGTLRIESVLGAGTEFVLELPCRHGDLGGIATRPARGATGSRKVTEMAQTLFDKYGGFAVVSAVVHDFYDRILASDSLRPYFATVDVAHLIDHQVKFLCKVLGGPDKYSGRALRAAHAGLAITPGAFGEVAGHLKASLEGAGVQAADVTAILSVVASTHDDVVGH